MKRIHYRLLLVEDDEIYGGHVERLLKQADIFSFDIISVQTGKEGLEKYQAHDFDCVLLDYSLPDITGIEFIESLKQDPKLNLTPIIMLTGLGNEEIAVKALRYGAVDYLTKAKLDKERLASAIITNIKSYQLETKIREKNKELQDLALEDHLTRLPNRRAFFDEFERFIAQSKRYKRLSALLYIDLNEFKNVNDTFGHDVGDKLLVQVTSRLKRFLRKGDMIARLGGDEFAVLLSEVADEHSAGIVAHKICNALKKTFIIEDSQLNIGASIGIACFVRDTDDMQVLLKRADIAMYQAKTQKQHSYQYYEKVLYKQHSRRLVIEQELKNSISQRELFLVYQPILHLETDKIISFEALIRWKSKKFKQLIMPDEFIPIAENTGFIHELGLWVIKKSFEQFTRWKEEYEFDGTVSINLSPLNLNVDTFFDELKKCFAQGKIDSNRIHFELNEQDTMLESDKINERISALSNMGIELHIDDFGTGLTSLKRLKKLDITTLKIDVEFVKNIGIEEANSIIESIVSLAKAFNLNIIAEGIETKEQKDFLLQVGCYFGQGFLFSPPVEAKDIKGLLGKFS